ncbi:uncharacterized protein LOC119450179 isoform X3 [Dermacentor silvarum]|uniref:uncharacterized protein LOC119450179 isoform X3 n=1 Tax=Dermacentor silvarum TaxID=543639 RepID=UPI00210156EB|nr:uncharacterized protein LOC119450179 isoform X3 [Dermacentor silvarum]
MGTESMEDVGTILRSILTSEKSGILLRYLDNEYRTLTGTRIPYRQMGFSTLEEYLRSIPDVVRLSTNADGNTVVHVVVSESTAHVAQMVRGQKSSKPRPVRKSYRRPSGQYNAGYRPNHLLSKLTRSRPAPTSPGDKRRPGYELYHPPQQRSFGTTSTRPVLNPGNWSRKGSTTSQSSDIGANAKTTLSSIAIHQPRSTYQTPPRFQTATTHSASFSRSPSKGREGWGKESEPRDVTSVVARQSSTVASAKQSENKQSENKQSENKQSENKRSSWQELDNSWSKSTYKPSTRSAAEFWEFGAGDTGKQSWASSQTTATASEASRKGNDTALSGKAPSSGVCAEPAEPVATATTNKSFGWADKLGTSTTLVAAPAQPKSTTTVAKPSTPTERRPTIDTDQPRFDPFRQPISLDFIPMPSPEHAAAAATAAAAAVPSFMPCAAMPSPAPKELGISLQSPEPTATKSLTLSLLLPVHASSAPSVQSPLVPSPAGPLSKPRPAVEDDDEIPVRGKHFTVDDVSIPQTPNCQLVLEYARREGLQHSYSTMQDRSQRKKGPATWLATLRLGECRFGSYPEEKATQDEAKETAAARAVAELGLYQQAALPTYPVTPVSSAEEIAVLVGRITSLLQPHGMVKEGVESLYKENYSEQLPGSWFEHLVRSELVRVDRGSRCILYPRPGIDQSYLVQNGSALSNDLTSSPSSSTGEPSTITEYVDVFVSCVSTTASVCFRFVEYEATYEKLLEDMATFFNSGAGTKGVVSSPELAELYATFHDDRWLRVQPLKDAKFGKVEVCFVDEGNTSLIPVEELQLLPECFTELAHQAIECQLDGLVGYANCDGIVKILSDLLLGKTLVAEIIQREDPVSVILFDTWGPEDVNLNHAVFLSLMKPRLPEKGCVGCCYLSNVTDSGLFWIQVNGPGLETLNNFMTAVNDYCKETNSITDDPVVDKVYGCRSRSNLSFYRSVLLSPEPLPSGEFRVLHVDYGYEERCYLSEFRNLDRLGDFVLSLPFQAVPCRLRGLTEEDGVCWSLDMSARVHNLSGGPDTELLIRVAKPKIDTQEPVVELFRRNDENRSLISINNTVIEALKQTRCPGLH